MIEHRFIPDGIARVPPEARDHGILATYVEQNVSPPDSSPIDSWRDVERVVSGSEDYVALRLPGAVSDYNQATLDSVRDAISQNITGVKAHPDGWEKLPEPQAEG